MEGWKVLKVQDFAEVIGGGTPSTKSKDFWGKEIPWITPKDLSNSTSKYIQFGNKSISNLGLQNSSAKLLPRNSLLFSSRAPIGYLAINTCEVSTNQGFKSLIPKDGFDTEFLYYLFKNEINYILSHATGTTFQEISGSTVKELKFLIPEYDEQTKISDLLSVLDKKIELNHKMNETLEEMAKAIFKSWFVDFEPVHAKAAGNAPAHMDAETAALFPSSFGDDGLPEGWINNELSDVCSLLGGYAFKSKEFVNEGMPVVKIKNITGIGDVSLEDCQFIESKSTIGKDKFKLEDGDLLIAMTGATVGKTGIVTDGKMTPYLNQRVGKFVPNLNFHKWAIWAYLQFQKNIDSVVATGTGSAQTNISSAGIVSVKWTEATHEIYKAFDEIVAPFFNLWISNMHQNQTLTELRDTLLPKLISGDLKIPDAEKLVSEVF